MASKEVNDRIKASKHKHELHVLFLMDKEGLSKANATTLAYLQGYEALSVLLSPAMPSGNVSAPPVMGK